MVDNAFGLLNRRLRTAAIHGANRLAELGLGALRNRLWRHIVRSALIDMLAAIIEGNCDVARHASPVGHIYTRTRR
jgi:hypothetical protein